MSAFGTASISSSYSINSHGGAVEWQEGIDILGEALDLGDLEAAREIFAILRRLPSGPASSLHKTMGVYLSGKVTAESSRTLTHR